MVLSKAEILQQFDLAIERVKKSPGNFKFATELRAVKAMVSWTSAEKFPYYWTEIMNIMDAVRTLNDLRRDGQKNPNIKQLAVLQLEHVQQAISIVPKVNSEYDAMKVLARAKATMQYGALRE